MIFRGMTGWLAAGLMTAGLMTAVLAAQPSEFYPLEMVKPGQTGVGKTIFEGNDIEEFQVEILGVLENFGPKQNMILARLSGGQLERTGVFGGMSGSPVYLEGRLVGAVAFSFAFSKEPIAGITPIGEMVDIFRSKPPLRRSAGLNPSALQRLQQEPPDQSALLQERPEYQVKASWMGMGLEGKLIPIATPLSLSGFTPRSLASFEGRLRELGLIPLRGLNTNASNDYPQRPLQPGSSVSVQLVRGDMDISASGTVTHISGDKIYAFGHPFLGVGETDMPLNQAAVVAVIPSLQSSNKVSATLEPVGSIRQDRSTGIYGIRDAAPRMIPVSLKLETSRNDLAEYNFEIIDDAFLTPFMINLTVNNVIVSSERSLGAQTLRLKCDIQLKGQPNVVYESNIASMTSTPALAAVTLSSPVAVLLDAGFEDLEIEKLNFEISAQEKLRRGELIQVWQDRLEARAGEEVGLTLFLRRENGRVETEKHGVRLPEGLSAGALKIAVGDGISLSRSAQRPGDGPDFIPRSLGQLVKAINNLKTNDRLYVRLFREQPGAVIGNQGMPALPPSMLALYKSRKTPDSVRSIDKVVYFEYELSEREYVLNGEKTVEVLIKK
ncbi:MAG TPA: SpoIVB peptidase S55 domain-containing protein [Acidobacteriota bacterium]|nr:SpoIVB peptidase S55 domain-containing protein [Acidobacteriota bacterium]